MDAIRHRTGELTRWLFRLSDSLATRELLRSALDGPVSRVVRSALFLERPSNEGDVGRSTVRHVGERDSLAIGAWPLAHPRRPECSIDARGAMNRPNGR